MNLPSRLAKNHSGVSKLIRAVAVAPAFAAFLAATSLAASAALPQTSAGGINANGTIAYGSGFTVSEGGRPQTAAPYGSRQ